jgi:hypothetical protein
LIVAAIKGPQAGQLKIAIRSQLTERSQFVAKSPMSSLKQIAASRRNALKSTGPITEEGKARSRRNAIRHGLTAETVIAGLEDAEDYQAFEEAVAADYEAETAVERELVLRLASILWRLRRATGIESALFEQAIDDPDKAKSGKSARVLVELTGDADGKQLKLVETEHHALVPADTSNYNIKTEIGDRFRRLTDLPTFPLDRLSRYEHLLWRQARQLILTLERLRQRRFQKRSAGFPFSFQRDESSGQ